MKLFKKNKKLLIKMCKFIQKYSDFIILNTKIINKKKNLIYKLKMIKKFL